ncbi:MAG: ion transporter [Methanolinea sp.]|nr:ion transporter [Methanolinea sp.]
MSSLKARVYSMLEGDPERGGRAAWVIDLFLMLLIIANVAATVLESVRSIAVAYPAFFAGFEVFSVAVFSVEYVLRLWTCTRNPAFAAAVTGRLKYAVTPLALVDLLAVLPFYVPFLIPADLRFMRILRLMRIFRLLKMSRYTSALRFVRNAFVREKEVLAVAACVLVILVVFSSCLMFYLEHEAQPEAFSNIPQTMWWAVETLTTVGYGDIVPVTAGGKVLGSFIAILGIAMFAVPTGILATAFLEEVRFRKGNRGGEKDTAPETTIALLERLEGLRDRGVLSDEEFCDQKKRILGK